MRSVFSSWNAVFSGLESFPYSKPLRIKSSLHFFFTKTLTFLHRTYLGKYLSNINTSSESNFDDMSQACFSQMCTSFNKFYKFLLVWTNITQFKNTGPAWGWFEPFEFTPFCTSQADMVFPCSALLFASQGIAVCNAIEWCLQCSSMCGVQWSMMGCAVQGRLVVRWGTCWLHWSIWCGVQCGVLLGTVGYILCCCEVCVVVKCSAVFGAV